MILFDLRLFFQMVGVIQPPSDTVNVVILGARKVEVWIIFSNFWCSKTRFFRGSLGPIGSMGLEYLPTFIMNLWYM